MTPAVADTIIRAARDDAERQARADLAELRRRAVAAGRDRSRRIVKTSRIDPSTGGLRYNPAGRILRDWYLHAYLNTLRSHLGEPHDPVDARQVENTTALLHRVAPTSTGRHALHAVAVLRDTAADDAAHATLDIVTRLQTVAARRALAHTPDTRFDGDQVRVHLTRHWYLRCYTQQLDQATGVQRPQMAITPAEQGAVTHLLTTRHLRQLIGPDGIPLLTAHGTALTDTDRRLQAGATGIVEAAIDQLNQSARHRLHRDLTAHWWRNLGPSERAAWLGDNDGQGIPTGRRWESLYPEHRRWILDHHPTFDPSPTLHPDQLPELDDTNPALAAQAVFNQRRILNDTTASQPTHGDPGPADDPTSPSLSTEAHVARRT